MGLVVFVSFIIGTSKLKERMEHEKRIFLNRIVVPCLSFGLNRLFESNWG